MCEQCSIKAGGIRPCPADDAELLKLEKARRLSGPKLQAMLPTWLKRELFKPPKPFVFVPNPEPILPDLRTRMMPSIPQIPQDNDALASVARYVSEFNSLNGLKP